MPPVKSYINHAKPDRASNFRQLRLAEGPSFSDLISATTPINTRKNDKNGRPFPAQEA
jgi:hypothetical protein